MVARYVVSVEFLSALSCGENSISSSKLQDSESRVLNGQQKNPTKQFN